MNEHRRRGEKTNVGYGIGEEQLLSAASTNKRNVRNRKRNGRCEEKNPSPGGLHYLHTSEFRPPTDIGVRRGGLEAHCIPVGGLNVFKVVYGSGVVLLETILKDHERISDKQMGHMLR